MNLNVGRFFIVARRSFFAALVYSGTFEPSSKLTTIEATPSVFRP
jgi:hypothetical protein